MANIKLDLAQRRHSRTVRITASTYLAFGSKPEDTQIGSAQLAGGLELAPFLVAGLLLAVRRDLESLRPTWEDVPLF